MIRWNEIDAILADIERLECATNGRFHQAHDREALDIVSRALRKARQNVTSDKCNVTGTASAMATVVTNVGR